MAAGGTQREKGVHIQVGRHLDPRDTASGLGPGLGLGRG